MVGPFTYRGSENFSVEGYMASQGRTMSTTRRALRGPWVVGDSYSRSIASAVTGAEGMQLNALPDSLKGD